MKRKKQGFTLIEVAVGLAVSAIVVMATVPSMSQFYARQQLKTYLNETTGYIQSAREMSASTECVSRVNMRRDQDGTAIRTEILRSSEWKGCEIWFQRSGQGNSSSVLIQDGVVRDMTIQENTTFEFEGVSGSLAPGNDRSVIIRHKGQQATLTLNGIGNGVVTYAN